MERTMHSVGFLFFPFFMAPVGLLLYFLPTILAAVRRHHNILGVFLLNFFLGWTVIGWIVALVWAMSAPPVVMVPMPYGGTPPPIQFCPQCGRQVASAAAFCGGCGARV
jgi:uncharacterized membrane protein YhaH (DUF805 family)